MNQGTFKPWFVFIGLAFIFCWPYAVASAEHVWPMYVVGVLWDLLLVCLMVRNGRKARSNRS